MEKSLFLLLPLKLEKTSAFLLPIPTFGSYRAHTPNKLA